jgi:hypothetical protein
MMAEQVMVVEDYLRIMLVVEGVVSRDVYSLMIVDFQRIDIRPPIQETLNCPFPLSLTRKVARNLPWLPTNNVPRQHILPQIVHTP